MNRLLGGVVLALAFAGLEAGHSVADEPKCESPAAWFPVTPKPTYEKPDPDQDCDFYMWAWQTFLYVTQPETPGGPPRFLGYSAPEDIFPQPSSTPRFSRASRAT